MGSRREEASGFCFCNRSIISSRSDPQASRFDPRRLFIKIKQRNNSELARFGLFGGESADHGGYDFIERSFKSI